MNYCARCNRPDKDLRHSWFDWSTLICKVCAGQEKGCPNFRTAHLETLNAISAGLEPPVIGLTTDDLDYLATVTEKWQPRHKTKEEEQYDYDMEHDYA